VSEADEADFEKPWILLICATLFLMRMKHVARVSYLHGNILSEVFGRQFNIANSLFETWSCRGLWPLTGWFMVMTFPERAR
jgi:hypothetical protein